MGDLRALCTCWSCPSHLLPPVTCPLSSEAQGQGRAQPGLPSLPSPQIPTAARYHGNGNLRSQHWKQEDASLLEESESNFH